MEVGIGVLFVCAFLSALLVVVAGLAFSFWRTNRSLLQLKDQLEDEVATLRAQVDARSERMAELLRQEETARTQAEKLQQDFWQSEVALAKKEAALQLMSSQLEDQKKDLSALQERMKLEFENLAHRIFEEKSKSFHSESEENLKTLLTPLREHLQGFQKSVQDAFSEESRERFSLKNEIDRICTLNEKMTLETHAIAQALKGDVKSQGVWGEMILARILEESGLREGEDYILQGEGLGLKNIETGSPLKPDVIVRLPHGKHLIIDSKVSLEPYRRVVAAEDPKVREVALKAFLSSVRQHIIGLESRRYQDQDGLDTPDFVFMFMPIEGAYALALQADSELHNFSWNKRVIFIGPWNLYATLRTVSSLWGLERQNKNALEIAKRGGALYDKFVGFLEDMKRLGGQLDAAQASFAAARNKLANGQGNLVRQVELLRELGAKGSKSIPDDFQGVGELALTDENGDSLLSESERD